MMRRFSLLLASLLFASALSATETPLGDVRTSGEIMTNNNSPTVAANGSEWLVTWNGEGARVDANGNVLDRPALTIAGRPLRILPLGKSYLVAAEGAAHEIVLTRYEPDIGGQTVVATIPTTAEHILTIDLDTDGSSILVTWIEYSYSTNAGVAFFNSDWNLVQRTEVSGAAYAAASAAAGGGYLLVSCEPGFIKSRIVTATGVMHEPATISPQDAFNIEIANLDRGYLMIAGSEAFILDAAGLASARRPLTTFDSSPVRIACSPAECLAVSSVSPRGATTDVLAARFSKSDGELLDSGVLVHTSKLNSRYPTGGDPVNVAWNGSRFLVVTSDGLLSYTAISTNIYGRFLDPGERIAPDELLFLISYRSVPQTELGAAVNGGVERFVWSEPTLCPAPNDRVRCSAWTLHAQAFDASGNASADLLIATNARDDIAPLFSAIAPDGDGFVVAFIQAGVLKSVRIGADGTLGDIRQIAVSASSVDVAGSLLGPLIVWSADDGVIHLLVHDQQSAIGNGVPSARVSTASDGTGALVAWRTDSSVEVAKVDLSTLTVSKRSSTSGFSAAGPFVAFNGFSYVVAYELLAPDWSERAIVARRFGIDGAEAGSEAIDIAHGKVTLTAVGTVADQTVFVFDEGEVSYPSVFTARLLTTGQVMSDYNGSPKTLVVSGARGGVVADNASQQIAYQKVEDQRAYVKELGPTRLHAARVPERRRPIHRTSVESFVSHLP